MIEQGIVKLIQFGLTGKFPEVVPGGYATQLPKDTPSAKYPKAWTYMSISSEPEYFLSGQDPLTHWTVQIDCHGLTATDAEQLARAIDGVLRGAPSGQLQDSDGTHVQGIFRQGHFHDGYNDVLRTYVRSLEYLVQYNQI